MLKILGPKYRFCDGLTRRDFIKVGGLAMGGLSLPQILRAESAKGAHQSHKATIMIFLPGGPPHQDMLDLKMQAPREIRGEFHPIKTNVSGIEICELLPQLAKTMDKMAVLRSIFGGFNDHTAFQCFTGHTPPQFDAGPPGGWPTMGSIMSKIQGPAHPAMPPYIGLPLRRWGNPWSEPGFLGMGHAPFEPMAGSDGTQGDTQDKTGVRTGGEGDLVISGIALERLENRKALLAGFDRFRRDFDASGAIEGMDLINQQAFGILTSSRLLDALDVTREDQSVRDRYGKGVSEFEDGGPRLMENFLVARRLVEAGARCVTVAFGRWDWHQNNFSTARRDMPMLDQGVAALVQDLHERNLDKDVSVIVWGEFGRTPMINNNAGRDHWPQVNSALLFGGGMRTGQVIGSTDRLGAEVSDRPIHFQEVLATLYHCLGINTDKTTVSDLAGRPHYLVDHHQPLPELI